ncbi:tetratricopeptide repeat protein [uncultured Bradyrhizobium sp.]|jgi:tetratricopeptide (TPR) repeat protein|uniref:tetratricopeptide repeat protein n=1 Tax=uncultured Bradyrhizobium sp. TaxID=199684 RepID=UPI002621CC4B|nr:tetratricopeptide repeat protein [uncultured Bradyrhizobium sp.]
MYYLARGYAHFDQHSLSAEYFSRAYASAKDDPKRQAKCLRQAAEQYALGGQPKKSRVRVESLRSLAQEHASTEWELLQCLADQVEREKDKATELAVTERMIEIRPDDAKLRFQLAYQYGELGRNDLSLYHYLLIPRSQRSAGAWNNLGAISNELSLPAKAVDAYKQAAEMNETLAMSNLGYKLMQAGFVEEALEQYKRAIAVEDPHKNVGQLFSALQSVFEEENEQQQGFLDEAKKRVVFLQKLGGAVGRPENFLAGDNWHGPECILASSRDENIVKFEGYFDRANPFSGGLLAAIGTPSGEVKARHRVVYSGSIRGQAIFGTITTGRDGASTDLGLNTSTAYMFFNEDATELYAIVDPDTDKPTYQRLTKVQSLPWAAAQSSESS